MRRFNGLSLLAAGALFAAPALAQAGAGPVEGRPFTASGEIELCECRLGDHVLRLEGGRRYEIKATADAFDSVLRVYRSGSTEALAEDDDSGGESNPMVTFVPPESGDYLVRVLSWSPEGAGTYSLTVNALDRLPAPATRSTGTETMTWQIYDGTLDESDPADNGLRFDDYAIELQAGQSAIVRLESEAFDPVVRVYSAAQRGAQELALDDDSGGGFNSFLLFSPEQAGTYIVRVSSYSTEGLGAYRLRIAR